MEYSGFYDDIKYDSSIHALMLELLADGVIPNYLNGLKVSAGTGLQVIVDSGGCISKGRFYIQDEPADGAEPAACDIDAASAGYLRKDRVVVEFNTGTSTTNLTVEKGTEATSNPSTPSLQESSSIWQKKLAIVTVQGGTIISVEDDRIIGGARTAPSYMTGETKCVAFLDDEEGWVDCDGRELSRTDEAKLFARIGTIYGEGDGVTTFNVPDFRERAPVGYRAGSSVFGSLGAKAGTKTHQLTEAELAAHTHEQVEHTHIQDSHGHSDDFNIENRGGYTGNNMGVDLQLGSTDFNIVAPENYQHNHEISGSVKSSTATNRNTKAVNENAGGGQAHNNISPSIAMRWIIKT